MANKKTQSGRNTLLKGASVLAAAAAAFSATPAVAQDDEAIVVTGTRVTNPNLVSSSPITSVDSQEFDLSGTNRVEDLVNQLPQLAPSFDSFTVNPTTGFATADLRGLGTNRTLVLVNGHRLQPGGIRAEARDLNQIPAALVSRVEVLTGGASAVYGSDAMAGVVNFILDNRFEGVNITAGISAYQHNNDNGYIQNLMDARGFTYPTGDTGFDGVAYTAEVTMGGGFADGRGHATAYMTFLQNEELRQGARDYSSCALNASGTLCGGSGNAPIPNFLIFSPDFSTFYSAPYNPGGGWVDWPGAPTTFDPNNEYNYAPINHYQRPDERWTFGGTIEYEVNSMLRPYVETMFTNTNTSVQIAESGTFGTDPLDIRCDDPTLHEASVQASIAAMCSDLGISDQVTVFAYKRNVEGGPRVAGIESNSFRAVAGLRGDLNDSWAYDVSYLYGRNASVENNINDFLRTRTADAMLGCPPGSFSGCLPYNVWAPGGAVDPAAAAALAGTGMRSGATSLQVVSGYVTGDTGITLPTATDSVSLVIGAEHRRETYTVRSDTNMETNNFTGLGGPRLPIDGEISVSEVFAEAGIPIIQDAGILNSFALDLGYRLSEYSTSGTVESYKAGASAEFADIFRIRGGYNRAIRAANTTELFANQQIALWGGADPCAGGAPTFTLAQCQNTGVSPAQYGTITASPASQYNQFVGGNPNLDPEIADTYTVGFVVTPRSNMSLSVDYYDIAVSERIGTIGAATILNFCGTTGSATLCSLVNRRPGSGDLWVGSDPATSGYIENLNANFGELHWRGIDLSAVYRLPLGPGDLTTTFTGSHVLEQEIAPLPGVNDAATYDCAGVINVACQTPEWRHMLRATYSWDRFLVSARWRYVGEMDYINQNGTPGTQDQLLVGNGNVLDAYDYFDLSGSIDVTNNVTFTMGVNNIMDEEPPMVGAGLVLNANSIGGYDQLGRYFFATVGVRF